MDNRRIGDEETVYWAAGRVIRGRRVYRKAKRHYYKELVEEMAISRWGNKVPSYEQLANPVNTIKNVSKRHEVPECTVFWLLRNYLENGYKLVSLVHQ